MKSSPIPCREIIQSQRLPKPKFHYSPVVKGAGCIFISGLVGIDPESNQLAEGDGGAQTRQVLTNLLALFQEHQWSLEQILHARVYCAANASSMEINQAWDDMFAQIVPPARTFITVHTLPLGAAVEMDFVLVDISKPSIN